MRGGDCGLAGSLSPRATALTLRLRRKVCARLPREGATRFQVFTWRHAAECPAWATRFQVFTGRRPTGEESGSLAGAVASCVGIR